MDLSRVAQVAEKENVINLGIGQPEMAILPNEQIQAAMLEYWADPHPHYLAYGHEPGPDNLRHALATFLTAEADDPTAYDDLFISGGASQALDLICTLYTKPGDTIFIEEPTYFLALRIFEDHHLNMVAIPMDDQGLITEALENELKSHRPKFIYTIPTFHNPSGVTQSAERREKLVELSIEHNFLIVADEVYHLLHHFPDEKPPQPLASYVAHETVISVNSFSKILAPGLRLGWIKTAGIHLETLWRSALLDSGGGVNPFAAQPVRIMIESGRLKQYLIELKNLYRRRINALDEALQSASLAKIVTYHKPLGGYFFWLKFPDDFDTEQLWSIAQTHGVGFQRGPSFSHHKGLKNYARLSFAYYSIPQLQEAISRLDTAVKAYLSTT
ncbi:MAG: PLP-dependent aminotransferase family protein [Ardenticatenaceae bacterium]|nr:PLP-dependent aminotransferase family protein [Ardenticatenaceae bacterium]